MINDAPIVCIGVMVADLIGGPVSHIPDPGGIVLVDKMGLHPGGGALNTAMVLAELGMDVELIGRIGSDSSGRFLLDDLRQRKIGTSHLQIDDSLGTSATMVLVDPGGERRFIHYTGAHENFALETVNLNLISSASVLLVSGAMVLPRVSGDSLAQIFRTASDAGAITCLDPAWDDSRVWSDVFLEALPYVDYLLPSWLEARKMTGCDSPWEAVDALLEHGTGAVVIKMGLQGCLVKSISGEEFHIPAFDVESVDATGAGDCFDGGFIAGLRLGRSLMASALLGSAVGALCVGKFGAVSGARSLAEVEKFMLAAQQRVPDYAFAQQIA